MDNFGGTVLSNTSSVDGLSIGTYYLQVLDSACGEFNEQIDVSGVSVFLFEPGGKLCFNSLELTGEPTRYNLKTNDDFANIMCHLSEISSQNIEDLDIGTNIVVKGICTGYLMDVVLVKTEILN